MDLNRIIYELDKNVRDEILQPWLKVVSVSEGVIHSAADREWNLSDEDPLSSVLLARVLWTFSRASRIYGVPAYKDAADLAYYILKKNFADTSQGGYFWSASVEGEVVDPRKHIYSQSFVLYGLSEYGKIEGSKRVKEDCRELFQLLMKYGWEGEYGGFIECRGREWQPLEDQRLSVRDLNVDKSMNTNLHAMEALSNYLDYDPSDKLRRDLKETVEVVLRKIVNEKTGHFDLFFNRDWSVVGETVSYGHDIEGSWLIWEALEKTHPAGITDSFRKTVLKLVDTTLGEGIDKTRGGCFYEGSIKGAEQKNKDWWPQAEALIGFLQGYLLKPEPTYLSAVEHTWDFIHNRLVDKDFGGWFWSCDEEGNPLETQKAGPWQCPYHNARACWESIDRIQKIKELQDYV